MKYKNGSDTEILYHDSVSYDLWDKSIKKMLKELTMKYKLCKRNLDN